MHTIEKEGGEGQGDGQVIGEQMGLDMPPQDGEEPERCRQAQGQAGAEQGVNLGERAPGG
jgi:hypothetical protein